MLWRLIKTAAFSIVAPGSVGFLVPQLLRVRGNCCLTVQEMPGGTLFLLGVVAYLWCAWDFVAKGLGTPLPLDAPRVLVVKGLYRFTRNPMYLAVLAMIFGQAIAYHSGAVALYGCVVLLAFHLFVRFYEEPTLKRLFGAQYEEYCRKVPRWLVGGMRA